MSRVPTLPLLLTLSLLPAVPAQGVQQARAPRCLRGSS